jgi:hypothetical protein
MAKSKKNDKIGIEMEATIEPKFQIRNIELVNFTLSSPTSENLEKFLFDVEIKQQIEQKDKTIISNIVLVIKDVKGIILGNLSISCVFEVENLNDLVKSKASFTEFGLKINKITIATARGVMFGLFRGTFLHNAILPIVDAQYFQNKLSQ